MSGNDAVIYDDEVRIVPAPVKYQVLDVVGDVPLTVAEFSRKEDADLFAEAYAQRNGKKVRHGDN